MDRNDKASPHVNAAGFDPRSVIDPSRVLIPALVRLNEESVVRGFWPTLRKVAARIPFAADVLQLWYMARDPETPATAKGLVLAALAYFVLPIDAIPDILPALGYTDDAAVIAAVIAIVGKNLKPAHRAAAEEALARLAKE
jgi:uncharacterized membrane protein YkvA (DUF1232 family)